MPLAVPSIVFPFSVWPRELCVDGLVRGAAAHRSPGTGSAGWRHERRQSDRTGVVESSKMEIVVLRNMRLSGLWDNLIRRVHGAVVASTAALLAAIPLQTNAQIANGGFETGDFTGWMLTSNVSLFSGVDPFAAAFGSFGAYFGPPVVPGGISQTFATRSNTTYQVDFWLELTGSSIPNSFSWSWNGVTQSPSLNNAAAFDSARFSSLVLATDTFATIAFNFRSAASFWLLDNVAVTAVPELPINVLVGMGLIVIAVTAKSRTRKK